MRCSSLLSICITYLDVHTRCTVLKSNGIEGDDFVARWILRHPDDEHIIISGDSDFVQLLAPNVHIYDAINQRMIGIDKITNAEGRKLEFSVSPKDGKIKINKPAEDFEPEAEWWKKALFVKLIRGDIGDLFFRHFLVFDMMERSMGLNWLGSIVLIKDMIGIILCVKHGKN